MPGEYRVVFRAYNETYPEGVSATMTIQVLGEAHYVAANNPNPVSPYTSWLTAATNIQDAVDAASVGNLILVTNGTYSTGGRAVYGGVLNRVAVHKSVHLRSVNGPEVTTISANGDWNTRGVYLTNGASLSGFTVRGGSLRGGAGDLFKEQSGAGVWAESEGATVTNCIIADNAAPYSRGGGAWGGTLHDCILDGNSAFLGGGAGGGTLNHCTLTNNTAIEEGGGAFLADVNGCLLTDNAAWTGGGAGNSILHNCVLTRNSADTSGAAECSTLNNCTVVGNSAKIAGGGMGGGWCASRLKNCILIFNNAPISPNYGDSETLDYCCTTPLPITGQGNITNAPLFVDRMRGNLRLQAGSPCINAGNNAAAPGPADMNGDLRIVSGTVDMGAYEFQASSSVIPYAWLQRYGLPDDGSADYADSD